MEYNCLIIEDQLQAQKILENHIENVPHLKLLGKYTNAFEAIPVLNSNQIDIIFLDINLPKLSGIEFLKTIDTKTNVIITTAFSEYAVDGFELDVCDYLLKPISFERFFKAVSKIIYKKKVPKTENKINTKSSVSDFIFAKDGHDIIKIYLQDIHYVKSDSDFTYLFLKEKKLFLSYSLKFWQDNLPKEIFFRCHKSFIVNINYIDKISGNNIFLNDSKIPIGRTSKELLLKKINLV